ncbi:hypothetical protein [Floridanema aerugineum]|uniref:Uncharacterized protein n=1 Tax=Floridaenema aerugineum BLCC-F46 TaxID=3153654 RepID=A0ABV4XD44_9CYAN
MYEAYLVISETERKLVNADEVDYSNYRRIFQCPRCYANLTLRKGYSRNNRFVRATFVHPEGDLIDCELRVSFNIDSFSQNVFNILEKGQSNKKLEKAFINCYDSFRLKCNPSILENYTPGIPLLYNSKLHLKRQIEYNEKPGEVYPNPKLFVDAASAILNSLQCQKYFEQKIQELENYLNLDVGILEYIQKVKKSSIKTEIFIKYHCKYLKGISRFISRGVSDECRQEFLRRIIWGDKKLPVSKKYLWTQQEKKIATETFKIFTKNSKDEEIEIKQMREPQVKNIQAFDTLFVRKISEKETQYLREAFLAFYQGGNTPQSEFIRFILSQTVESIQFYDWSILPDFYQV